MNLLPQNIKCFKDIRGTLTPLTDLPFHIKRVFYIQDIPQGSIRGDHAHITTKQVLICIKGTVEVMLHDGKTEAKFILTNNQSIFIPEMIWDTQKYLDPDTIVLVLCSTDYKKDDYIYSFKQFLDLKKEVELI